MRYEFGAKSTEKMEIELCPIETDVMTFIGHRSKSRIFSVDSETNEI